MIRLIFKVVILRFFVSVKQESNKFVIPGLHFFFFHLLCYAILSGLSSTLINENLAHSTLIYRVLINVACKFSSQ